MYFMQLFVATIVVAIIFPIPADSYNCPSWEKYGQAPPTTCNKPRDPQARQSSAIENWFTKDIYDDLFPKSNLGWGPNQCRPYNYEAFIIAARYFPRFGTEYVTEDPEGQKVNTNYSKIEIFKRDLSAFFAHSVQETGENDVNIYDKLPQKEADSCFYRGGMFNWFEGGPVSPDVHGKGWDPSDGELCTFSGKYCDDGTNNEFFYPCANETVGKYYKGCYFGRGPIQISYSFNYGLFNRWLNEQKITHDSKPIDLMENPNLIITKTDPPLSFMASLWFFMTPQSPKPSMHDIIIGNWVSPDPYYAGSVFGPTSLVINNECNGEDPVSPGGGGENRRIKAFRWFTSYFNIPVSGEEDQTLSCKTFNGGARNFKFPDGRVVYNSWDADWRTSSNPNNPCTCVMETYQDYVQAFDPSIMPQFQTENENNKKWCEQLYQRGWRSQACSKYKPHY